MTYNAFTPERIAQLRREVMENATPMTLRSALHTAFNFFPAALDEIERLQAENADFAEQLAIRSETGMAKDMQEIMAQNNALSASITQAQARIARLGEALTSAKAWHRSEDKALSKSGRSDPGYHWARCQHKEQISAIGEVMTEAEDAAALDRINARAALKGGA